MITPQKREIHFGRPWIGEEERSAVLAVLETPILTHGPKGHEFEEKFTRFMGAGFSVTTSSCMASLHLATMHFGFGPGDEVLVPAQTHVATVHAVELVGAKPVFVDCELQTVNMDVKDLKNKITTKTKGIIVVHFAGIPAPMDSIMEIAKTQNLKVIEDCALAVGGRYKSKHVGLWGDVGCYSFYPVKHITTTEGGMIVSQHEEVAKKIAHFRAFSVDRTHSNRTLPGFYDVNGVGLNYRMGEVQAALGCAQMDRVHDILRIRKENFERLKKQVTKIKGISSILDSTSSEQINSHYCMVALLEPQWVPKRNEILLKLKELGVGTSIYYPQPVGRMSYYQNKYGYKSENFKNAEYISDGSMALPVGPHLNIEDMDYIADKLKQVLEG